MDEPLQLLQAALSAHIRLALSALAAGVALSLPIGVLAARRPAIGRPLLALASVVQTIPSLALLAAMVPILAALGASSIGFLPAFLALVAYSVLPVLRNTVAGLQGVDPAALEAADGLGMTPLQRLWRVELPLSLPTILAGIRTSGVWTVGIATLSTPIGASSLGDFIFSGLQTRNHASILVGCVASAGLALLLDASLQLLSDAYAARSRPRALLGALLLASLGLGALVGPLRAPQSSGPVVVIGAKTFTEQYILAALLAGQIEAESQASTEIRASLGSTVAFDALKAGDIDVYVDYTGTIWATILGKGPPGSRDDVLSEVRRDLKERYGVEVAAALGFENTYALAMQSSRAKQMQISSISDLAPRARSLSIGADYEFLSRPEWSSLREIYGLSFSEQRSMDPSLLYGAAASGEIDVISAFSTDGRISAYDLVTLEDDRGVIPPYDAIVLVSRELSAQRPEIVSALRALEGAIDAQTMRAMNASVDERGELPGEVAARFLAGRAR